MSTSSATINGISACEAMASAKASPAAAMMPARKPATDRVSTQANRRKREDANHCRSNRR